MKKHQFSYRRVAIATAIISAIACSVAWRMPSFALHYNDKPCEAGSKLKHAGPEVNQSEEGQLIQLLATDGRINEAKGFVVEKKQSRLFIDGVQVPADIAAKYTSRLKKDEIRIEVHPFSERLMQHPDASFIQVLLPVLLSSPCVDIKPKKEGC